MGSTNGSRRPAATTVAAAAAVAALLLAAGCGLHNPYPAGSFDRGAYYAERGNDLEAVQAFETFVRQNPTDSLAAEAQYLKAMSYMELQEYPLAAVEFQILRKDYPVSDRVEDAAFMEGLAALGQVGRVQRDITGAHEARLIFSRFIEQYPDSPRVPEAREHLQEISDLMVRKRLSQVKVFRQLGRHEAVALVLDDVLRYEAGSTLLDRVLWERARTAERLEDTATAAAMYRRLVDEFPDSRYARQARGRLRADAVDAADAGEGP